MGVFIRRFMSPVKISVDSCSTLTRGGVMFQQEGYDFMAAAFEVHNEIGRRRERRKIGTLISADRH
jgi:hypothetical protein